MQDSIFTKIIKGEILCHKVYEDDKTFAFMDIHPLLPGHVLVIPKIQVDDIEQLPDEDYLALFLSVQKVAKQIKSKLGVKKAIMVVMGFDVPHAHVHVMPGDSSEEFYSAIESRTMKDEPDHAALAELAAKLAF